MKIQCDVCQKEEATLFCSADEAALCDACDRRVHRANKLAGKHSRYSLLHPTFKDSPLCDICQERKALLFCQEDRAILCRECDVPIHRANEHTEKHNRFLLTGVRLSQGSSSSSPATNEYINPTFEVGSSYAGANAGVGQEEENQMVASDVSTSSISEYLMETLPGWRVDDFLDCTNHQSSSSYGRCKISDPTPDYDFMSDTSSSYSPASWDIPVPVPHFFTQSHHHNCPPQDQTSSFHGVREPEMARRSKSSRKPGGFYGALFYQGTRDHEL